MILPAFLLDFRITACTYIRGLIKKPAMGGFVSAAEFNTVMVGTLFTAVHEAAAGGFLIGTAGIADAGKVFSTVVSVLPGYLVDKKTIGQDLS